MGCLTPARAVIASAIAEAMRPPPPPDVTKWCIDNIVFDQRSPIAGPFNIDRFPFLRGIHEVLSPEHPAREVTLKGSAQWGKTVSVINPTLGAWFEYGPLDALVVHPTASAATEWVDNKWLPMRRQAPGLLRTFGAGRGENKDAKFNQETLALDGSLKVASAGSPADLTGTTRKLVIMDDVAKFEMTDKGDPEALAESRASGFDDAKILRVSTALVKGTCRITRAYDRSDQRQFGVPCPHCGHEAPLTWENFKATIDPEQLHAAHFTCEICMDAIRHSSKETMVQAGQWVAQNPKGDHPGFFLWRAYAPQRDWASIAVDYARMMGWSTVSISGKSEAEIAKKIEAETEQTFYNDVLGLAHEQASGGLDWEALRDRVELSEDDTHLPPGRLPATGIIVTAGVDCQGDRTEVLISAWGENRLSWCVEYTIIPYHIGDQPARDALDALLKEEWKTVAGLPIKLDGLAIDAGAFTDDVWSWAMRHPRNRVIVVKGASTQNGPVMMPMQERHPDGRVRKQRRKRGFMLNVSQMKADFYKRLEGDDPKKRGFVSIAKALGDEFFRQITAEVRVLKRQASGTVTSMWKLVEATRRNEALDTYLYAEAMARKLGWASMTALQWEALTEIRGIVPPEAQQDLFDHPIVDAPAQDPDASGTTRPASPRSLTEVMP